MTTDSAQSLMVNGSNRTSITTLTNEVERAFRVDKYIHMLGGCFTPTQWSCAQDPFRLHPQYFFIWLFISISEISFMEKKKLVNTLFLSSVSCSNKL